MGYYVLKFILNTLKLKEDKTKFSKVFKGCELAATYSNIRSIKSKTNWYWEPKNNQHIVILSTHTIVYPVMDVSVVLDME